MGAILLLIVAAADVGPLHADPLKLSWQECIQRATDNNAQLGSAHSNLQSLRYLEYKERNAYFPQIGFGMSANRDNKSQPPNGGFLGDSTLGATTYGANINLAQNIFAGFETEGKVGVARGTADVAEENLRIIKAQVSFDLKSNYQTYLMALQSVKLTQDIIQRRQTNLQLVELRFQGGREDRGSLLISRANLEQARYDDLLAKDSLEVSRLALAKTLGIDGTVEFSIVDPIPVAEPPKEDPDYSALAEQTPEYHQVLGAVRGAQAGVLWARSGFFPHLDLTSLGETGGGNIFPHQTGDWAVGLTLNIPLFNGGRDNYALQAAKSAVAMAVSNSYDVKRSQRVRLSQSFSGYREAILRSRVDERFLAAATLRAELGRAKYKNGLLNFEEWNIIEDDLINRQKSRLQSQRDRVVGEAAWEQAMGKGVIP